MKKLLTRKDIAQLTGLSTDSIRRNEKELGLDLCRIRCVKERLVRYREAATLSKLALANLL